MTKSDSLDNITLDSDDIRTIERIENNYNNHKKNNLQIGGEYKLEKNIERLFDCYVLSKNQIGGWNDNINTKIETRLNKKIAELIINKNYFNVLTHLEGGIMDTTKIENDIKMAFYDYIKKIINTKLIDQLKTYLEKIDIKKMIADYINKQIESVTKGAVNAVSNVTQGVAKGATDLHKGATDLTNKALGAVGNLFQPKK